MPQANVICLISHVRRGGGVFLSTHGVVHDWCNYGHPILGKSVVLQIGDSMGYISSGWWLLQPSTTCYLINQPPKQSLMNLFSMVGGYELENKTCNLQLVVMEHKSLPVSRWSLPTMSPVPAAHLKQCMPKEDLRGRGRCDIWPCSAIGPFVEMFLKFTDVWPPIPIP